MKYIPEPFKIKMVEPIAMTSREERANILTRAHYNIRRVRLHRPAH